MFELPVLKGEEMWYRGLEINHSSGYCIVVTV